MKKGIPCNETRFTKGALRDRISFRFVTDDGFTPSGCTVRLGDIDPMTGEKIIDMDLIREYHRDADREIHKNLEAIRVPRTKEYMARRKAEIERFIAGFEKEHTRIRAFPGRHPLPHGGNGGAEMASVA